MSFKVGDIIKGKPHNGYCVSNDKMTEAIVVETYIDSYMIIKINKHLDMINIGKTSTVRNTESKFELIEEERKMDVKKGVKDAPNKDNVKKDFVKPAFHKSMIKTIVTNGIATIVFWKDGTKTIVKCHNEVFDSEKALAMAIVKKMSGNNYEYYEVFKKWCPNN